MEMGRYGVWGMWHTSPGKGGGRREAVGMDSMVAVPVLITNVHSARGMSRLLPPNELKVGEKKIEEDICSWCLLTLCNPGAFSFSLCLSC